MFVYAMRGGGYAKIGVSEDIEKRLKSFNRGALPFQMTVICLAETGTEEALEIEAHLLGMMPGRLPGEWFDGDISDEMIISSFKSWPWAVPVLVRPSAEQVAEANRDTTRKRQLEASRTIGKAMEDKMPVGIDWHKIATELTARGDVKTLRKVKKAFKSKRLAAQHKATR